MAPKRSTRAPATTARQGTLSFNKAGGGGGSGGDNRVTKPTVASPRTKAKDKDARGLVTAAVQIEAAPSRPPDATAAAQPDPQGLSTASVLSGRASQSPPPPPPPPPPRRAALDAVARADADADANTGAEPDADVDATTDTDPDATAASALSPGAIKAYWRQKQDSRLAPRVHQHHLPLSEKMLREWDMDNRFGPCIGISREKRWRRAKTLGLAPPLEVLAVLRGGLDGSGGGGGGAVGRGGKGHDDDAEGAGHRDTRGKRAGTAGRKTRRGHARAEAASADHGVEQRAHVDILMGNRVEVGA